MGAPFIDIADTINIAKIEAGMNAMKNTCSAPTVHEVDIAGGALAIFSEKRSFDPVGAGQ